MYFNIMLKIGLLACFTTTVTAGNKKTINKIIIQVPYKVHKHHHIHTKYKLITVPEIKKEPPPMLIYKKPLDHQNFFKYPELTHQSQNVKEAKGNPTAIFPHQKLESVHYSDTSTSENMVHLIELEPRHHPYYPTDLRKPEIPQQSGHSLDVEINESQPSIAIHELSSVGETLKPPPIPKSLTPEINHFNEVHDSDLMLKPSLTFHPATFIPNFIVPHLTPPKSNFFPKYHLTPKDSFPHYSISHFPYNLYSTMSSKILFRPSLRDPLEADTTAHSSNQVFKPVRVPKPYLVKESNEDIESLPLKYQYKAFVKPNHSTKPNSLRIVENEEEPEYEHVGYLIIDGNTQKIVDKNFQNKLLK